MENRKMFAEYLQQRIELDEISFFEKRAIQKAYYTGAYAQAIIIYSWYSKVSQENTTFKSWLSSQVINYRNLDRILEIANRFERKLKLKLANDSEVQKLAHSIPATNPSGISNSKISYAFVAGLNDYKNFVRDRKEQTPAQPTDIQTNPETE